MAYESCVRLFASVDLIGSTAYKNRHEPSSVSYKTQKTPWIKGFEEFYLRFSEALQHQCELNGFNEGDGSVGVKFFKAIGDELIFQTVIKHHRHAIKFALAFRAALQEYNAKLNKTQLPLQLKGTMWIAGLPINHQEIQTPEKGAKSDYLGPSIDAGFRITKFSTKRKLSVSVDLALLLTASSKAKDAPPNDLVFYFDGQQSLKGVLGDRPYPIIWIEAAPKSEEEILLGIPKDPCDAFRLNRFCRDYISELQETTWLIEPYFADDDAFDRPCAWHQQILQIWQIADSPATGEVAPDESEKAAEAPLVPAQQLVTSFKLPKL